MAPFPGTQNTTLKTSTMSFNMPFAPVAKLTLSALLSGARVATLSPTVMAIDRTRLTGAFSTWICVVCSKSIANEEDVCNVGCTSGCCFHFDCAKNYTLIFDTCPSCDNSYDEDSVAFGVPQPKQQDDDQSSASSSDSQAEASTDSSPRTVSYRHPQSLGLANVPMDSNRWQGTLAETLAQLPKFEEPKFEEPKFEEQKSKPPATIPTDNFPSPKTPHRLIHGSERPFRCDVAGCAKSFRQRSHLMRHAKTHAPDGGKTHKCQQCTRSFSQRSNLKVHLLTHNGGVPKRFRCEVAGCAKGFSRRNGLKRHLATLHQPNTL